ENDSIYTWNLFSKLLSLCDGLKQKTIPIGKIYLIIYQHCEIEEDIPRINEIEILREFIFDYQKYLENINKFQDEIVFEIMKIFLVQSICWLECPTGVGKSYIDTKLINSLY